MIDLKQEALKKADGFWKKLKISLGSQSYSVGYICRNVRDFLANKDRIELWRSVAFSGLLYFLLPRDSQAHPFSRYPVEVGDVTGEFVAYVDPLDFFA